MGQLSPLSPLNVVQVQLLIIFDQDSHPVFFKFSGFIGIFAHIAT
tara:strand:+ start:113547 stop:113681 length:135 start_codon:yes stop_codon:yes gene_type:complete